MSINNATSSFRNFATGGIGEAAKRKFRPGMRMRGEAGIKYVRVLCQKGEHGKCFANSCTCLCHCAISQEYTTTQTSHKVKI